MKKFFAAMIMVCLSAAFSASAMAQGVYRDNGRYGQNPIGVYQPAPAPGYQVGVVPGPYSAAHPVPPPPGPRHAHPAPPPPGPHHGHPLPPPPPGPHHGQPLPPPPPEPAVGCQTGRSIYIGGKRFGITLSL